MKAQRIQISSAVETPQKKIETNPRFEQTQTKPVGLTQIKARAERKKEGGPNTSRNGNPNQQIQEEKNVRRRKTYKVKEIDMPQISEIRKPEV